MVGARVVTVSEGQDAPESVIVALDTDAEPPAYAAVRFHLDCSAEQLTDALELVVAAPLAIFVDPVSADSARAIADAGHSPGIDLATPVELVADFLAVLAHSRAGFIARATNGPQVLAIVAATVAALRGDDVRTAFRKPNPAALSALNPEAVAAVREVLLGVEVDDPTEVIAYLTSVGLR